MTKDIEVLISDSNNEDELNKIILMYLNKQGKIDFKKVDQCFSYSNGYFSKLANLNYTQAITKTQAAALENKFNIPSNLFFNNEINSIQAVKNELETFLEKDYFSIHNSYQAVLDVVQGYSKFYIYDENSDNKLVIREFKISGTNIEIYQDGSMHSKGFIYVSSSNVIIVTENLITGNNLILKIRRSSLVGNGFPVRYLGHSAVDNREIIGYGVCLKKEYDEEKIRKLLDPKEIGDQNEKEYIEAKLPLL